MKEKRFLLPAKEKKKSKIWRNTWLDERMHKQETKVRTHVFLGFFWPELKKKNEEDAPEAVATTMSYGLEDKAGRSWRR